MSANFDALREAADWFAVLESGRCTAEERSAWQHWLTHPEHAAAWRRVERISSDMRQLAEDAAGSAAGRVIEQRGSTRRRALKGACVLGVAATLGWSLDARQRLRSQLATWSTGVGEIRELQLADDLRLWLNTDSALDNRESDAGKRRLELLRGELLVEQRAPSVQALAIASPQGLLRAEGPARFALRSYAQEDRLMVFSGDLLLQTPAGPLLRIAAGQQLHFDSHGERARSPVSADGEAWSRGMLIADGRRLGELLEDLARYRHGYLGCDPRVADLRVVGAFPLAEGDQILDALARSLPIRVNRLLPWWVSVEPA